MSTSQPWLLSALRLKLLFASPSICAILPADCFTSRTSLVGVILLDLFRKSWALLRFGNIRLCCNSKPRQKLTLLCVEGLCVCAYTQHKCVGVSGWWASVKKKREERGNWLSNQRPIIYPVFVVHFRDQPLKYLESEPLCGRILGILKNRLNRQSSF